MLNNSNLLHSFVQDHNHSCLQALSYKYSQCWNTEKHMVTFPQIGRFTLHTPLKIHSKRLTKTRLQSAIYNLITQLDLGLQKSQQTCSLLLQLQQKNSATNKVFNPRISPYISPYFEPIYLLIESSIPPHGS